MQISARVELPLEGIKRKTYDTEVLPERLVLSLPIRF